MARMSREQEKAMFAKRGETSGSSISSSDRDKILKREFPTNFKRVKSQETGRTVYWFEDKGGNVVTYLNVSHTKTPEYEIRGTIDKKRINIKFPLGSTKKISAEKVLKAVDRKAAPSLPPGWKQEKLENLLTKQQLKEVNQLVKKREVSHKKLLEIIKKDDSKYKGKMIPEFFAYALENQLNQIQKRYKNKRN